ncbi:MAG: sulfide/dihydroorotate dehydrogenase-like FAD/NAD-binding protein [Candidatus Bathyarchaeota archaeon]
MYRIINKKVLAPNVKSLEIEAPRIARKHKPGQFVIIRIYEKGENIPLTLFDVNAEKGTVSIIFQEVGKTTKLLGSLKEGDYILNMVGPLGKPTEIKKYGRVIGVGGGVGVAELYPELKALKDTENEVASIIGARTAELIILEKEMRAVSDDFYITTDDGSRGHHGLVIDVLKDLLKGENTFNLVITIGPTIMMKTVAEITRPYGIRTLANLNPIMVDGTGMCGSCRAIVGGETKFTCVDGPEFDAHLVDFSELMTRQRVYVEEEKISSELHSSCVRRHE